MDPDDPNLTRVRSPVAGDVTRVAPARTAAAETLYDHAAARVLEAAREPEQGDLLRGRYRLEEMIGQGGMGQVWRCRDLLLEQAHDPRPYIALKLLNRDFASHPDAFVALQREAGKAQQLAHPNIATVFTFDRDDRSERIFLTMELLEGEPLEALIAQHRGRGLARREAVPIIRGIAEGLAYAHRKGIVHSDLKPANIFLQRDGTPKILDFGIARAVPTDGDTSTDSFDAGSLGGYTAPYATVEMIEGQAPAPADDLYSLAVIACELLEGRHPFSGKSAPAAHAAQARPPALRALTRSERHAILQSLSFERLQRPRDAGAFLRTFSGARQVKKALLGAIAALAAVSAYLWYSNYQQEGPAIPFEQLPADTQQQLRQYLSEGQQFLQFYEQKHEMDGFPNAVDAFVRAYGLQKGNRTATAGLRRVADDALDGARDSADRQRIAAFLAQFEYLKGYAPVRCALGAGQTAAADLHPDAASSAPNCTLADSVALRAQRLGRRVWRLL